MRSTVSRVKTFQRTKRELARPDHAADRTARWVALPIACSHERPLRAFSIERPTPRPFITGSLGCEKASRFDPFPAPEFDPEGQGGILFRLK